MPRLFAEETILLALQLATQSLQHCRIRRILCGQCTRQDDTMLRVYLRRLECDQSLM
jgi:hypothetical protein